MHKPAGIEAVVPELLVRERYWKIHATYNRVLTTLASDANEYLPLYRLHDVLMIEIWDYLNIGDRHNIATVSRRFRSIAINTSRLWTLIDFRAPPSVPRIRILLKRAGGAPLHLRVTDDQMNAIHPSLLSPNTPTLSRPLPAPLRPPRPLLSPPAYYPPRLRPSLGLNPLNSIQPSVESVLQAAALDILVSQKSQFSFNLGIENLPMVMPMLNSLRISVATRPFNTRSASTPVTKSLLGIRAPLLRHLAVIQLDINWSDPVFRNLTYLLVRRPNAPMSPSLLVQILRACPSLTYLGLEAAISPTGPNETFSSVELPALQRLYITDVGTQRIAAALNRISAPNILECDLTSADWGWFDNPPTLNYSPLSHLQGTQEVTLWAPEQNLYRWTIEYRCAAERAVRLHFVPALSASVRNTTRDVHDDTTEFIEALRGSPILFGQVRSLTLRGTFVFATLTEIFGLFPEIEKLSTRDTYNAGMQGAENTVLDILSVQYCLQLRAIDIGAWPILPPSKLLTWLYRRSAPWGGRSRLKEVVVTSGRPLPSMMRSRISAILDKLLWRKNTAPYCGRGNFPFVYVHSSGAPPSTKATTLQQNEDGTWDNDDDEKWARVPSGFLLKPQNMPSDEQDDPTIVYCDRDLQGRWSYFAFPGP